MQEQLKATRALLDIGVSVPLRPLRWRSWKWVPRVTMRRPPLGGMIRILKLYLQMNTTSEQLRTMNEEQARAFFVKNARSLSKIVALAVCSGYWSGKLLAPLLAWVLRWRCNPGVLFFATSQLMELLDAKSFTLIIRSIATINLMEPSLSQKKGKRS